MQELPGFPEIGYGIGCYLQQSRGMMTASQIVMNCSRVALGLLCVGLSSVTLLSAQRIDHPSAFSKPIRVRISSSAAAGIAVKRVLPQDSGVPGEVAIDAFVSKNGRVLNVRPISGDRRLQQAAKTAVLKWHFMPYFLNGEPVQFLTALAFHFDGKKGHATIKALPEKTTIPPPPTLPDLANTPKAPLQEPLPISPAFPRHAGLLTYDRFSLFQTIGHFVGSALVGVITECMSKFMSNREVEKSGDTEVPLQ